MLFGLLVALKYNLEVMIFGEGYEGYTDTDTHDETSMNFNMRQQNSSWEMGQLRCWAFNEEVSTCKFPCRVRHH